MKDSTQLQSELAHFTGTEHYWRHPLSRRILLTDGAKYLADEAGAWWLIDIIVSHQLDPKVKAEEFQVWKFQYNKVTGPMTNGSLGAKVYMTNGDTDDAILVQEIEFTDFPFPEFDLWCCTGGPNDTKVLMLKSEY